MWLRDPKRPESRATLGLGRSYTQHAPTTQHEVAAVYPIPPCFEVGQAFRDASSPGLPWGTIFDLFRSSHTKGLKSSQTAVDLGDLTGGTMLMVRSSPESNWQPLAPRRRGVAT